MKSFLVIPLIAALLTSCWQPDVTFDTSVSQQHVPVLIGKNNNVLLRICVDIKEQAAGKLHSVTLTTNGTTRWQDIESAGIYYTGPSDIFQNHVLFADEQAGAASYKFEAAQTLKPGPNFFWVSVKLKPEANILNRVGIQCTEVNVSGKSAKVIGSTSGSLRIGHALRNKDDDGSAAFRIPGLVTTTKGTLIAVYDIRWRNSRDLQDDIDVGINRSMDGGQTWLPMQKVMDMGEWGGLPQAQNGIGDPCILYDQHTGRTWIAALWAHGKPGTATWNSSAAGMLPSETGQFMLAYSDDDGATWSEPINITAQVKKPEWTLFFQGPGMGIAMEDGTLVFPAQYQDKNRMPYSTLISSKDQGKTWQVGAGARENTTEAQIAEAAPGVLMLNMRDNRGGSRAVSITRDLGKTWEEHPSSRSALREPVCMASLIKADAAHNASGHDIMLFSNPDTEKGRYNMTIKTSFDSGLTWPLENQVLLDEGHGWGYSCLTMINPETVGILYEGSGSQLCFQAVPLKDLLKK